MAEIGPRLKLIRQNMGITQRELARELGINQAILSKFERGNMVYASVLLDVLSYSIFSSQATVSTLTTSAMRSATIHSVTSSSTRLRNTPSRN